MTGGQGQGQGGADGAHRAIDGLVQLDELLGEGQAGVARLFGRAGLGLGMAIALVKAKGLADVLDLSYLSEADLVRRLPPPAPQGPRGRGWLRRGPGPGAERRGRGGQAAAGLGPNHRRRLQATLQEVLAQSRSAQRQSKGAAPDPAALLKLRGRPKKRTDKEKRGESAAPAPALPRRRR